MSNSLQQRKKQLVIGILAHVDAGKTTLSESILYHCNVLRKVGRVDHKDTFLDTNMLEKDRGITIFSKQACFPLGEFQVTLLDTPGHIDFSAEMERTLPLLDYAILVINGADGVQGHTKTLWKLLKQYNIPVLLFVNKMDQEGTDREHLQQHLQQQLSSQIVDMTEVAVDEGKIIAEETTLEALAVCEDALMERYLEGEPMWQEEVADMLAKRQVFPCYYCSALKRIGGDK